MAQVSETSASPPSPIGPLQTRGAGYKPKVSPDKSGGPEDVKSNPIETQDQGKDAREVRQKEDRVLISREAQEQGRGDRVEEGKRNVDNLRPQKEQNNAERGAAQKIRDLENSNARGVRDFDESAVKIEPEYPSGTGNNRAGETRESRVQSPEAEEPRSDIEQQATDRKNAEVQLREFQTRDEVRIEPKIVSESVEEIEGQRAKAEAAKEPALEAPSQRIIQENSTNGSESARSAENKVQVDEEGSTKNPPNPVSVQTETGQNVDDLI